MDVFERAITSLERQLVDFLLHSRSSERVEICKMLKSLCEAYSFLTPATNSPNATQSQASPLSSERSSGISLGTELTLMLASLETLTQLSQELCGPGLRGQEINHTTKQWLNYLTTATTHIA